ncbi:MAG TPA: hypothetical protein VFA25_00320 [Actinomycetota bacterium]|nr:hypothetical protein [Actinomycetota bacterium]
MPPSGMVNALEEIQRLLRPAGTLIDIHPVHGSWIEVRSNGRATFVEPDPGFDSDDELRPTERALETVLGRGLFVRAADREFDFLTYAASVVELRDFFALVGGYDESPASPRITRLRDEIYRRASDALDASDDGAQLVYREQVRASRLIPPG